MKISIRSLTLALGITMLGVTAFAVCPPPVEGDNPDIKVNGSDDPIVIRQGSPVQLTINLVPGLYNRKMADWWILAYTPNGWAYLDRPSMTWNAGFRYSDQAPLCLITQQVIFYGTDLPPGEYMCYFGFECIRNGLADLVCMCLDTVAFTIN